METDMPYKGPIDAGSTVSVTFSSFTTNSGTAFMLVGCGTLGGESSAEGREVAPGGFATLSMLCAEPGIFKIDIDLAHDNDSGELEVTTNGALKHRGRIVGDTNWSYSII
jgi:hypothetical protein